MSLYKSKNAAVVNALDSPYDLNQPFFGTIELAVYAPDHPSADPATGRVIIDQKTTWKKPDHLIQANVKMSVGGIGATLDLTLFDREFIPLEIMLSTQAVNENAGKEIQFRWGYTDLSGRINPALHIKNARWYNGKLIEVVPTYSQEGVTLQAQVVAASYEKGHDRPKRRGFVTAGTGQKQRTYFSIGDAVRKICEENQWALDMRKEEEPEIIEQWDSPGNTLPNPISLIQKEGQSDLQFLKELASMCRTKATIKDKGFFGSDKEIKNTYGGRGGYEVWFESVPPTGGVANYGTLHFYPPRWSEDAIRSFYINMDEQTEVISFTPQISHGIMTKLGADACEAVCFETLSKRIDVLKADDLEEEGIFTTPAGGDYIWNAKESRARRIRRVFHSRECAKVDCKNEWYTWNRAVQSAQLVIQGDPRILPKDMVWVFFFTPTIREVSAYTEQVQLKNKILYSSGKYQVQDVTHTISGGTYQTTLALQTTGTLIPMPLLKEFNK